MQDTDGAWGWAKKAWRWGVRAWNSPAGRITRRVVSAASWFVPGGAVVKAGFVAYKGYRLYRTIRGASRTAKDMSASRGSLAVAGRLWTRSMKKRPYSWAHQQGNKRGYRLTKGHYQYRSPTLKRGHSRNGYYANFNGPKKFNMHVRVTNPRRSWARWR